jgi:hypothetical protein
MFTHEDTLFWRNISANEVSNPANCLPVVTKPFGGIAVGGVNEFQCNWEVDPSSASINVKISNDLSSQEKVKVIQTPISQLLLG